MFKETFLVKGIKIKSMQGYPNDTNVEKNEQILFLSIPVAATYKYTTACKFLHLHQS